MYIYIYTYIYVYVCISISLSLYIYIYIYIYNQDRLGTADPWTRSLDFRGLAVSFQHFMFVFAA